MSKQLLRIIGSLMAVAGIAILAFAIYSYVSQQQLEAQLEAQVPGQTTEVNGATTTPVLLLPSLTEIAPTQVAIVPTLDTTKLSPSVTPPNTPPPTPVQPDATIAAQLAKTLGDPLIVGTPVPTFSPPVGSSMPTAISLTLNSPTPAATASPTPTATPTPKASPAPSLTAGHPVTPTSSFVLAGVQAPSPVANAPTVVASNAKPQGVPRGSGQAATRLIIPKLNMNLPIVQANYITYQLNGALISDWNVPFAAAGHLATSAQPGEIGNAILSGHHNLTAPNTFGLGAFAGLWNLVQNDQIGVVTADGKTQVWRVTDSFPVKEGGEPIEVRIQHATEIMSDGPTPELTLLTCWNGKANPLSGNTYRWVIHAELLGTN